MTAARLTELVAVAGVGICMILASAPSCVANGATTSEPAGQGVATIDKRATLPVMVSATAGEPGQTAAVLVIETSGVWGNVSKVPLSGNVVLKVDAGLIKKRVPLGHFFVFGWQSELPESYAFNLATNTGVTASDLEALKAGKAEAEVSISPANSDRPKAALVRLLVQRSYLESPGK